MSLSFIHRFRSYLQGRMRHVPRGLSMSSSAKLICGDPQGSVLGPILFPKWAYTVNLVALVEKHALHPHLHSDGTQIYS